MELSIVVIIGLIFVVIVLALATASVVSAYNLMFDKFQVKKKRLEKEGRLLVGEERLVVEERQLLKTKLDAVVGKEASEFQNVLVAFKAEAMKLLTQIGDASKDQVRGDIADFRKMLSAKIDKELADTKADLELYKTEKKKQIDTKAKDVLTEVANKVIPGALDPEKHEELIIKSLEKAKADHFFDV